MKQMVETFNSEHDNIVVEMNTLEWADFYSKVPNAVSSGAGPDVAAMHVDQVGTNAARGVIMPLDEFTGAMDLNEDDFDATVWKAACTTTSATRSRSTCTRSASTTTTPCSSRAA
jgi:multiple sugar transport system substrate-binding protein